MNKLRSTFDEVKKIYFRRWDSANEWQIRRKTRLSGGLNTNARCNSKTKVIEIKRSYVAGDDNELQCLLCHEICHAVTDAYHGLKWQRRFLKVADRAAKLGQKELVGMIHNDVKTAQDAWYPTLISVHHNIEDALIDRPDASYEVVIEYVANNWALTSNGLLKKYKTLKEFFNKAQRAALLGRELQQRYGHL